MEALESMEADDIKLVNCAGCGTECIGFSHWPDSENRYGEYAKLLGRPVGVCLGSVRGRPYCKDCLRVRRAPTWQNGKVRVEI